MVSFLRTRRTQLTNRSNKMYLGWCSTCGNILLRSTCAMDRNWFFYSTSALGHSESAYHMHHRLHITYACCALFNYLVKSFLLNSPCSPTLSVDAFLVPSTCKMMTTASAASRSNHFGRSTVKWQATRTCATKSSQACFFHWDIMPSRKSIFYLRF